MRPEALRALLDPYPGPQADPEARPGGWLAAVALILRPARSGAELLIIRRADDERDPWSGHMALPGGRKDPADDSLLRTAIRETREEVGLDLERSGTRLGRLDLMAPASPTLPPLTVAPFVFGVEPGTAATIASPEVADLHWVSIAHLCDNRNQTHFMFKRGPTHHRFPAIEVEGQP
ncbi:MAG: CoA pyrophosphatase, partial [Gemmatimonadales bacterium]